MENNSNCCFHQCSHRASFFWCGRSTAAVCWLRLALASSERALARGWYIKIGGSATENRDLGSVGNINSYVEDTTAQAVKESMQSKETSSVEKVR